MARKWIILILLTMAVVVGWIFMEVYLGFIDKAAEVDYQAYLEPVSPELNTETLDDVLKKEKERLMVDRDILE